MNLDYKRFNFQLKEIKYNFLIKVFSGLFQKVALLSGTALSPGIVRDTAINATWALDRKLHCRSFNSSELLDCFRKQLKDEILDAKVYSLHLSYNS